MDAPLPGQICEILSPNLWDWVKVGTGFASLLTLSQQSDGFHAQVKPLARNRQQSRRIAFAASCFSQCLPQQISFKSLHCVVIVEFADIAFGSVDKIRWKADHQALGYRVQLTYISGPLMSGHRTQHLFSCHR